jgi:hypothetical protein
MDDSYNPDSCDDLDIDAYRIRVKYRHEGSTEESIWSEEAAFDFVGLSEQAEAVGDPNPLPNPPSIQSTTYAPLGGWWTVASVNGVTLRGARASIYLTELALGSLASVATARIVVEQYDGSAAGLVQAGVTDTASGARCGNIDGPEKFAEWKTVSPTSAYVCDFYGDHDFGTEKKYAVQRTSQCTGCWVVKINGSQVGSVHNLGTGYDDFSEADQAGATGEFDIGFDDASYGQKLLARWGKRTGADTPWQRTNETCPTPPAACSSTWVTISAPNVCDNTDDHYKFPSVFKQTNGWAVRRWARDGSPNHDSC